MPYLEWYRPADAAPGPPLVRGWCPGVFDPLLTGDGWLVRVRCPGGVVTPAEAAPGGRGGDGQRLRPDRADVAGEPPAPRSTGGSTRLDGPGARRRRARRGRSRRRRLESDRQQSLAGHDPTAAVDSGRSSPLSRKSSRPRSTARRPPSSGSWWTTVGAGRWTTSARSAPALHPGRRLVRRVAQSGLGGSGGRKRTVAVAAAPAPSRVPSGQRPRRARLAVRPRRLGVTPPASEPRPSTGRDDQPGVRDHHQPDRCSLVAAPFLGRLDATTLNALAALAEQDALVVGLTTAHSVALCGIRRARLAYLKVELEALGLLPDAHGSACAALGLRRRSPGASRRGPTPGRRRAAGECGSGRVPVRLREGVWCTGASRTSSPSTVGTSGSGRRDLP